LRETNHFVNPGYGWVCKHCSAADSERKHSTSSASSQSEKKSGSLGPALARWTDATRQTLACPRCSIEELINQA
jgi:hypothetical protein